MSFAKVHSAQPTLLAASIIDVEVDLSRGLHQFSIVGLPSKAVEESRDRVSAALKNSGYTSPKSKNQKIIVSLAPADLKKEGPVFDVSIALAYLLASEDIAFSPEGRLFLGELTLDGEIRPVAGVLPIVREAKRQGYREIYVPKENAREAALIQNVDVFGASNLSELIAHLTDSEHPSLTLQPPTEFTPQRASSALSLDDIRGQESAKRGLEIAAAGGHNIALYGPPGTGKTLLARALAQILPPLSYEEALEVTSIHSTAGLLSGDIVTEPPFRSPHHTASYVALIGGSATPQPGEVTLAHRGVLFLDEFPEFDRRVIEALRQPLEDRKVSIARAKGTATFPANFILVAAMNPCPCGNYKTDKTCTCSASALMKYQRKLSGPIIDRIDMWIEVPNIAIEELTMKKPMQTTAGEDKVRERVREARTLQLKRFAEQDTTLLKNSDMTVRDIGEYIPLDSHTQTIINNAARKYELSPRAYHRVLKLARTIADLDASDAVQVNHIYEALQYRPKQKI